MENSVKDYWAQNDAGFKSNKAAKKRKKFKAPDECYELVPESFMCSPSCLPKKAGINSQPNVDKSLISNMTSFLKKKSKKRVEQQSNYELANTSSLALNSSCGSFSPSAMPSCTPTSNINDSSMLEENWNPCKKRKKTSSASCKKSSEHNCGGKFKSNNDEVNVSDSLTVVGELDATQDSVSDIDWGNADQSISNKNSYSYANRKSDNTRSTFEILGNDDVDKPRSQPSLSEEEISQLALSMSLKYKKTIGGAGYTRSIKLSRFQLGPFVIIKSGIPHVSSKMLPLEVFIYKPKFTWTQSDERKADRMKWIETRYKNNVCCTEEIEQDLKEKIENIAEHFKCFCDGSLDEEAIPVKEMNKVNFYAPYLPTYRELHLLQKLDFSEEFDDSEVDDGDQEGYLLDSEDEDDLCDDDALIRREQQMEQQSQDCNRGTFSDRERKQVLKNWQDFQMKYKFYDLRPLLSLRTCMLKGDAEHFELHKLHYISSAKQKRFLAILGKGVNRNYTQILYHARCTLLGQTSCPPRHRNHGFSDREKFLADHFVRRYGVDCIAMEFINHSVNRNRFCKYLIYRYRYELCPIRLGKFSRMEIVRLIKAVLHSVADKPAIQRTSVAGIFATPIRWCKVFEGVKTRTPRQCCLAFHSVVKQAMQMRFHRRNSADAEKKISWTPRHELLLLRELCKSSSVHLNTVDFYSISRLEEFAPFCDDFLRRMARDLIASKVPPDHRLNLDEALEYLSRRVLPVLERKAEQHDEALRSNYLDQVQQLEGIIPDYLDEFIYEVFSTQPIYDEEEQDESLPNYSTSLFSDTRC